MGRVKMEKIKRRIYVGLITLLVSCMASSLAVAQSSSLKLKDLFPSKRVLDIQVTVAEEDWEKIRKQRRTFSSALAASRQFEPVKSPYSYVLATVTIDGVVFSQCGDPQEGVHWISEHIETFTEDQTQLDRQKCQYWWVDAF